VKDILSLTLISWNVAKSGENVLGLAMCFFFLNFIKVEFDREVGNVPVLYYPHDALLARSLLSKDVRLSVRLSHAGIV